MILQNYFGTLVLAALMTAVVTPVAGQTVMFDCTGSMANADKIQARLIEGLANINPSLTSFGVCLFSGSVLGADVQQVDEHARAGKSRIEHVNRVRRDELRDALRKRLEAVFASKPREAKTSHAAVYARADSEAHPTLLLTDSMDEAKRTMPKVGSGDGVLVLLCPARKDEPTRELETFEARKKAVLTALPNATVYQCHQIDRAIQDWSGMIGNGIRRASQQVQ